MTATRWLRANTASVNKSQQSVTIAAMLTRTKEDHGGVRKRVTSDAPSTTMARFTPRHRPMIVEPDWPAGDRAGSLRCATNIRRKLNSWNARAHDVLYKTAEHCEA
jgi:hypothetical protein